MADYQKLSDFLIELLEDPRQAEEVQEGSGRLHRRVQIHPDTHKKLLKNDDSERGPADVVSKEKPGAVACRIFAIW